MLTTLVAPRVLGLARADRRRDVPLILPSSYVGRVSSGALDN